LRFERQLIASPQSGLTLLGATGKVHERRRPHYSPAARFEILEIRNLLGWNQPHTANQFLVSDNTIGNWERDQSPESRTVGSLATPVPSVTRFNDATRHLVQMMARFGFGGAQMIASHLALAGFRIAEETVRNSKRERVTAPRRPLRSIRQSQEVPWSRSSFITSG
jgi:DNA-binding XRE family transcriptional regulator